MALNLLVSLFGRLVVRSGRKRGNRQTDGRTYRPSTVTLAAHARRGLTSKHTMTRTPGCPALRTGMVGETSFVCLYVYMCGARAVITVADVQG